MRFHAHKTFRLGPLYVTLSERGFHGWGIRFGRISHDVTSRSTSVHAGGGRFRFQRRRRHRG